MVATCSLFHSLNWIIFADFVCMVIYMPNGDIMLPSIILLLFYPARSCCCCCFSPVIRIISISPPFLLPKLNNHAWPENSTSHTVYTEAATQNNSWGWKIVVNVCRLGELHSKLEWKMSQQPVNNKQQMIRRERTTGGGVYQIDSLERGICLWGEVR